MIRPLTILASAMLAGSLLAFADQPDLPAYPDHSDLLAIRGATGEVRRVTTQADWAVRRAHILGHVQRVMGPLPGDERRVPLNVTWGESIDRPGYVRRKVSYASEPRDRVPAWLLIPKGGGARRPAILCLHQTIPIGKDEPVGLGTNSELRYAEELAERGYVCLAPDYPNRGEHKVDPYALGYASTSMKAIGDDLRGVDLLAGLAEVDPDRIGVIGHSLGGHGAIFAALFDDRIKAIVSSSGFNSFPNYRGGDLSGWSHDGYMPRIRTMFGRDPRQVPFDFPELVGALAPRPFYANAPLHDNNFPVEGVDACFRAAGPIYRLFGAENRLKVAHPDAPHAFPKAQRVEAYEFLDRSFGIQR